MTAATYTNDQLLDRMMEDEGFDPKSDTDFDSFLRSMVFDSVNVGACRSCGETSSPHEPDASNNWCPHCGAQAVVSALVAAGMA